MEAVIKISEALESNCYMVDTQGDVVIPVETWKKLLEARERLIERLEDQEDRALLRGWLVRLVGNS